MSVITCAKILSTDRRGLGGGREREREAGRRTDTETDRQTDTHTHRASQRPAGTRTRNSMRVRDGPVCVKSLKWTRVEGSTSTACTYDCCVYVCERVCVCSRDWARLGKHNRERVYARVSQSLLTRVSQSLRTCKPTQLGFFRGKSEKKTHAEKQQAPTSGKTER